MASGFQNLLSFVAVLVGTCSQANHYKWWTCNSECARCVRRVMPMEEQIMQFYSGLFSQTPPSNVYLLPEMTSTTVNSGTAVISPAGPGDAPGMNVSRSASNPSVWEVQTNTRKQAGTSGCCETEMEYITPPDVTINGHIYQVVHLKHAYQFIAIGRCKDGSKCNNGKCQTFYRAHWVLIYNSSKPDFGPPVSFSPTSVPSHCECVNIGLP